MFSDVRWNGAISCYRSPTQPDNSNAKWGFVWSICDICRVRRQSISSSHQKDTERTKLCFWKHTGGFTLSYIVYVGMKCHSRRAWEGKYVLMFKNIRKIDLIEREGERWAACNWKKNFILKPCMCSKDMPPQIHALFNLILYALQPDISPSLYLILLFSPRLTPPDFSFLLYPLLDDFHVFLCGALRVSSKTFPKAETKNFPVLPESFLILAEEQLSELSNDDSHRERADKPVWFCLWLYVHLILIRPWF